MLKDGDIRLNFKAIGITLFTFYMLTTSIFIAVFNSLSIQMVTLFTILLLLLFNDIFLKKGRYVLKKIDLLLLFAMLASICSLHSSSFTTGEIAGPIIFCLGILISIFIRGDIKNYDFAMKCIKWSSVFYALSVILSYLLPNLYTNYYLTILRPEVSQRISQEMQNGFYTGFTSQVAYSAGYIVNGIGLLFCGWIINKKFSKKSILVLIILLFGLLLTQKRAHMLFTIFAISLVYVQFSQFNSDKVKKMLKVFYLTAFAVGFFLVISQITNVGQLLFSRVIETFQELAAGEDITSNRIPIWRHAWDVFLEHPYFGVGWGNFRDTVIGNVTVRTAMETHNIYLQLLSETGVIGTLLILSPFLIIYIITIKSTRFISKNEKNYSKQWKLAVLFSLFTQTFFLLYGFTGNPLYDYSFLIMYFLAFGLIFSFINFNKTIK